MTFAFDWRGQPSTYGTKLMKGLAKPVDPKPITFSKRSHSSSIASAEKMKSKPGTGRSAST